VTIGIVWTFIFTLPTTLYTFHFKFFLHRIVVPFKAWSLSIDLWSFQAWSFLAWSRSENVVPALVVPVLVVPDLVVPGSVGVPNYF
jgi:hypothetical protein